MATGSDGFRWGILGAGHIAAKWAGDLSLVPGARLQAVWARDPVRGAAFAAEHGAARCASSVEDLLGHGDLDAVYVATPHGLHRDHALACLLAGVPVLCEKAFALDSAQAREMVDEARRTGTFLMEALWTRFLPGFRSALEEVAAGTIGRILSVEADFGFHAPYDPARRLWDPAMGGGALLDIGIYPLFFATSFLGPVETLEVEAEPAPNGVDRTIRIAAGHARGGTSRSLATFDRHTTCACVVRGERGELVFPPMFHTPVDVELRLPGGRRLLSGEGPGEGYQYEIEHVQECLSRGLAESPLRPLEDTLELTSLLDRVGLASRGSRPGGA
jgi:predicted dehydrogenase